MLAWCEPTPRGRRASASSRAVRDALDYSPEDSSVDFVLRDEGDAVCVEIHNGGPPIPADLLPRIFEPFRRATGGGHPSSGQGLGLFIVQQIAHAHAGRVEVRSTEAEGTTFSVWLPHSAPTAGDLPR